MEPTVMVAVLGLIEGIGVAIIGGLLSRSSRKRAAEDEARRKRDEAIIDLALANAEGTEVLLHQAHGDHLNGNVEHALASIGKAKSAYNHLCNAQMAQL